MSKKSGSTPTKTTKGRYKIVWMEGDGTGPEVAEASRMVLDSISDLKIEYIKGDLGWAFWCKEGNAFPDRTVELLKNCDAGFKAPITSKPVKTAEAELVPELRGKGLTYRSPIVTMRQMFDLWLCLRPCKAYPGNPNNYKEGIDWVVFRENTEDLYSGVEFGGPNPPVPKELSAVLAKFAPKTFAPFKDLPGDQYAISCKINTKKSSERIIKAAFEFAKKNNRKKVTVVCKANVVRASDGLFLDMALDIAKQYPTIQMDYANIDAMTQWVVKSPFNYDVIVAPNLYGEIISDLCAQLVGGLGFGMSGNIGDKLAVFEPTHGSAPKYAGQNKVNPIASIMACKMMLDYLGETEKGKLVEKAVADVIKEGKVRTYDFVTTGQTPVGCKEMAKAIAAKL